MCVVADPLCNEDGIVEECSLVCDIKGMFK